MDLGGWGLRKHVFDGDAHWRHLANTIEATMCGDDAAVLSNYFDHLLLLLYLLLFVICPFVTHGSRKMLDACHFVC